MFFFQNISVKNPQNAEISFKFKVSKESGYKTWAPLFESRNFYINSEKQKILLDEAFRDYVDSKNSYGLNFLFFKEEPKI